jgi:hypothetical protein
LATYRASWPTDPVRRLTVQISSLTVLGGRHRSERLALIAGRAYDVGAALAKDPDHAILVPHVEEIKRLKRLARGRKKKPQQDPPPPQTPPTPASSDPQAATETNSNVIGWEGSGRAKARPLIV